VISIVDPEEFKNVLRPTVYAATIDALPSAVARDAPGRADRASLPARSGGPCKPINPSQHN
jgi:hypothetical protein